MTKSKYPNVWEIDPSSYRHWIATEEKRFASNLRVSSRVKFSVVMPVHDPSLPMLREAVDSILEQTHCNWELCLADDASTNSQVVEELRNLALRDERVHLKRFETNQGIAAASNGALELASGKYIVLVDQDDRLPSHALATVEYYLNINSAAKLLYSDSDHLDADGERCKPFFNPDWDYQRLLSQNYLNHLTFIEHGLLKKVGGWRDGYQGSQDYDLYLRLAEELQEEEIQHIPHILYHWRIVPGSVARSSIGESVKAARTAIKAHLARRGYSARVEPAGRAVIFNHIAWKLPKRKLRVLMALHDHSKSQVDAVPPATGTEKIECRFLDLHAPGSGPLRTKEIAQEMDSGAYDAFCVSKAGIRALSEHLLEDTLATSATGLFGVIGTKCITDSGSLHGGPLFTVPRDEGPPTAATEKALSSPRAESRGYIANLLLDQSVDALSPEFLMVGDSALRRMGGLESSYLSVNHLADSLCRSARKAGLRNAWLAGLVIATGPGVPDSGNAPLEQRETGRPDTSEPFLYPNPNFRTLDWKVHWSD